MIWGCVTREGVGKVVRVHGGIVIEQDIAILEDFEHLWIEIQHCLSHKMDAKCTMDKMGAVIETIWNN